MSSKLENVENFLKKEPECHRRTAEKKTFTSKSKEKEKKKRNIWNDNDKTQEIQKESIQKIKNQKDKVHKIKKGRDIRQNL